jgi:hypothetical protein
LFQERPFKKAWSEAFNIWESEQFECYRDFGTSWLVFQMNRHVAWIIEEL